MTDQDKKNDKWNTLPDIEKAEARHILYLVANWMYCNNMTWLGRETDKYKIDIRIEKKELKPNAPDA